MRIAIAASLLAAGCGISNGTGTPDDPDHGTPENPVPQKTGPYAVRNTVDFTVEAILPPQAELVVSTLREFSTNPAHALITIADKAGVPAVSALYSVIPGPIKDRLEGWINDEIEKVKIAGKTIPDYAGQIAMLADTALTQFAVDSELAISGDHATHRLTGLDLSPAGLDVKIKIGGLAGDVLTQETDIYVAEGGALSIGEQHFGLNYGEYAWQGLEAASTAAFGQGIRATLGNAINCPNIASHVADKCVPLINVCVGHKSELTSICEGGLDAIVNFAHDRMAAMRLEAFHILSGTSRLVDEDGDGVGDKIVDGTWDAQLNLGAGLRHAPATFTGSR
jgi:hypothetical protein